MSYRSGEIDNRMMFAFMQMFVLFILFIIANFLSLLIDLSLLDHMRNVYILISFLSLPFIINYFLLWRKYKYRDYFRRFDEETTLEKLKWDSINLGIVAVVVLLMLWSFEVL